MLKHDTTLSRPFEPSNGWIKSLKKVLGILPVPRTMHVVETLPMGGKRYLAVISVHGKEYLVGGGADALYSVLALEEQESA